MTTIKVKFELWICNTKVSCLATGRWTLMGIFRLCAQWHLLIINNMDLTFCSTAHRKQYIDGSVAIYTIDYVSWHQTTVNGARVDYTDLYQRSSEDQRRSATWPAEPFWSLAHGCWPRIVHSAVHWMRCMWIQDLASKLDVKLIA